MSDKPIYLSYKLEAEPTLKGDIKGVAYSGGIIENYMWYKNFVVDVSTLSVAKSKTPLFRDHNPSQVAGMGVVTIEDSKVLIDGKISKKTAHGKEITDLSEDGFEWELSIGVFGGSVEEVEDVEVNGKKLNHGFVLKNGIIREVSIVALGADKETNAKILSENKGENPMLTKEQWVKFACACGGNKDTTPEELQEKISKANLETEEEKAKVEELTKAIEDLKSQIAQKEAEIAAIKEAEEVEMRAEEIKAALAQKNIELSSEKIEEASKNVDATKILLSLVADMKPQGKIDAKLTEKVDLGQSGGSKGKTDEQIRLAAEALVREGKAKTFIDAINMVEEI